MGNSRFIRLISNPISLIGLMLAIISGVVLLGILYLHSGEENPYAGLFGYLVLPPIGLLGLLLVPVGMFLRWRVLKRGGDADAPQWPRVDFNSSRTRRLFAISIFALVMYAVLAAAGSYKAVEHSESVSFCGQTCHSVMHPEFIAYQNSPHARVKCVECHVGGGAAAYAQAKVSGLRQLWALATDNVQRPIPTPIHNLRPARDTCEQCHWPDKPFGARQKRFNHFLYDEANSPWTIDMLILTGSGDPRPGRSNGIHWHMNLGNKVEYIARDDQREDIPWVRMTSRETGEVQVFQHKKEPLTEAEIAAASPRTMDCMDCHDRPAHQFLPPDHLVDDALHAGRIDRTLPSIKRVAVEAMAAEYETDEAAQAGIATYVSEYYKTTEPPSYDENVAKIDQAIAAVQDAYAKNMFPSMKVSWKAYRDNIGHMYDLGCMRCHDGKHVAADGAVISKKCETCHLILSQGPPVTAAAAPAEGDAAAATTASADGTAAASAPAPAEGEAGETPSVTIPDWSPEGLDFEHPEDIGNDWKKGCYECHEGTQP